MDNVLSPSGEILNRYKNEDKMSMRNQARKLGVSASFLCDIYYGNRKVSHTLFKTILEKYKYKCVGSDLVVIGTNVIGSDVLYRYKTRNHGVDDEKAIKDLIYINYGVQL